MHGALVAPTRPETKEKEITQRRTDWRGVFVVSVTLVGENSDIDEDGFRTLLGRFVAEGVPGVIVAGSTGEWYSMRDDERRRVFELARRELDARCGRADAARRPLPYRVAWRGRWRRPRIRRIMAPREAGGMP